MGTWIICGAIYIGSLFCQYKARNKMFWILATFTNEWHPFWKNILNICFSFYTCILWVTFVPFEVLQNWAVTEIVPYLIWAPDFFGPQEIWALHEKHYIAFSCRDQISWSPNFSVTKKVMVPNEIGDHFSCSHKLAYKHQLLCCNQNKLWFLLQKKSCEFAGALNWNTLASRKAFIQLFTL